MKLFSKLPIWKLKKGMLKMAKSSTYPLFKLRTRLNDMVEYANQSRNYYDEISDGLDEIRNIIGAAVLAIEDGDDKTALELLGNAQARLN